MTRQGKTSISRNKSTASKTVHVASLSSSSRRPGAGLVRQTLTPSTIAADRQHAAAKFEAEKSGMFLCHIFFSYILITVTVLRPSLQVHLMDFGEGSQVQPTASDDVDMHEEDNFEGVPPFAPFDEADNDEGHMEAVRQAMTEYRYVTISLESFHTTNLLTM